MLKSSINRNANRVETIESQPFEFRLKLRDYISNLNNLSEKRNSS